MDFIKKLTIPILFTFVSQVVADEVNAPSKCCKPATSCCTEVKCPPKCCNTEMVNASPNCCKFGVRIFGEYLYWKVVQDQLQYAGLLPGGVQNIINQIVASPDAVIISERASFIDANFRYNSGFRVGAGFEAPCNWDFLVAWTRLHEKVSSCVSDNSNGIIPITMPISSVFGFIGRQPPQFGFASSADSCWRFQYDTIDFQIGKNCCILNCQKMRPFVGLKAAWIKQIQEIQYFGFSVNDIVVTAQNTKRNDFKGIGPSFGIDTAWPFFSQLSLISGINGALLVGNFHATYHPHVSQGPNSIQVCLDNSKCGRLQPVVDARIGVEYTPCICNALFLVVGASFEAQYWWNQWQVAGSGIASGITGGSLAQGDLMMYGLTVNAGIAF